MPPRFIPLGGQGGGGVQGGGRFQPWGGGEPQPPQALQGVSSPQPRFIPWGGHAGASGSPRGGPSALPSAPQPNSLLTSLQGLGGGLSQGLGLAGGLGLQVPHAGLIGGAGSLVSGAAGLAQPGTSNAQKASAALQTAGGGAQIAQDLGGQQVPGLSTAFKVGSIVPNIVGRSSLPKGEQALDATIDLGSALASLTPFGTVAGGMGTALQLLLHDAFGKPAKSRKLADALETQGLSNVQNDVHARVTQATTPDELYAAFGPVMDHARTGKGDYPLLLDSAGKVIPYTNKAAWLNGLASGASFAWQGGGSHTPYFNTALTDIVRQRASLLTAGQSNPALAGQFSQQRTAQGQQQAVSDMLQQWTQAQVGQLGFTPPAPSSLLTALQGGPGGLSHPQALAALQAAGISAPLPMPNDPGLQNQVNLLMSQGLPPDAALTLAQQQLANAAALQQGGGV